MPTPLLELRHLSRDFGENKAIDDISFKVFSGQVIGVAGPSGSGKSALFDIICNTPNRLSKGELYFEGESIKHLPAHKINSLGIVRALKQENMYDNLSALNNVLLAIESTPNALNLEARESLAEYALQMARFPTALYSTHSSALSIFNQRQLKIAIAIALKPKLLLIDTPTTNLTTQEITHMVDIILNIRNNGISILLAEHALGLLLNTCEQILMLDKGKVADNGSPKDVISTPNILETYLETAIWR